MDKKYDFFNVFTAFPGGDIGDYKKYIVEPKHNKDFDDYDAYIKKFEKVKAKPAIVVATYKLVLEFTSNGIQCAYYSPITTEWEIIGEEQCKKIMGQRHWTLISLKNNYILFEAEGKI